MWTYTRSVLYFVSLLVGVLGISVNNGRYEDINIVIQDSVTESETLLDRIQEIFTNASQLLFQATKQHVYFGKINIILPKSWSSQPEYTVIPARSELDTYITVEESVIACPFTKPKKHVCGEPMHYIYLPVSFLLTEGKTEWGYHANVLVHEWGHYRWGLYNEYAATKNDRFYMKDGVWKPTRCSESVSGTVGRGSQCSTGASTCDTSNTEQKLDEDCKFCPDDRQTSDDLGSLMAFDWIDGVSMFCDNPDNETVPEHQRHNRDAKTQHNVMCNYRSAWEVMRDHEDFNTASLPADTNTTPEFEILQESDCYRVLVLDVSGSMAGSRISTLYQSSKFIIETYIPEDSWLGIVWFETSATLRKSMTQVVSETARNDLISALPTSASGSTCIGCGIETAISMLTSLLGDPAGSAIIVISDGLNNVGTLDASIQKAIQAQVIIHTLAVSQDADTRLIDMAVDSGGVHVPYLETESISFASALMEMLPCGLTSYANELTTILFDTLYTRPSSDASFTFDIDSSVGNDTTVSLLLDTSTYIEVEVSGPDGEIHIKQTSGDSIVFILPGIAVVGHYNAKVHTSSSSTLECYVTSLPNDPDVVRVSSLVSPTTLDFLSGELPVILVNIVKGRAPILWANVTATVETGTISCLVTLLDSGAAPDAFADDGTYTAVIPRSCLSNGRIATKVYARGENGTALVLNSFSGTESDEDSNNTEVLKNSFQRFDVSNEILMTNVVDQDIIAPGRITDVEIVDIVTEHTQYGESRNFTITWTATGDDVNIGQATEYELRISDDQSVLSNNFSSADLLDVVNTNFTPKAAGETEAIRIEVDADESYVSTAYFGVRTKDDAGNSGSVSNIVSIVVANGYRIKVEGDVTVVYSYTDDSVEESVIEEEKRKKLSGLAVGLSSAVAFIAIAIIAGACYIKKLKAKEIVEDSEFNSRTSITSVSTVDKPLKEFFTTVAGRQTVAKRTFQSSQLPTIPEREQAWAMSFTTGSVSEIAYPRKDFDIISQGECSIEMLRENSETFSAQMDDYLDDDSSNLSGQFSPLGTDNKHNDEMVGKSSTPLLIGVLPNFQMKDEFKPSDEIMQNGHLDTTEKNEEHANVSETKKKSKRVCKSEIFEERPVTCSSLSLELPVMDNDEISQEIKNYYEEMCSQ